MWNYFHNLNVIISYLLLLHADSKVGLIEFIRNIPPKRSELASLLNNGMEEAETKQQFPPLMWLVATLEEVGVRNGIIEVGTEEIGTETLGWFISHLHSYCMNTRSRSIRFLESNRPF